MTEVTGRFIRIVHELGPGFAERATRTDLSGEFVAENDAEMKLVVQPVRTVVDKAVEIVGGGAYFRRSRLAQFHPLPESKQLVFTGRVAMGLSPV